ncbi:response regulator receiver domain protein [Leptospira ryugenii]|uniref:Response regulator receiver domain protein n=1 Tax=Leptospira ryugenii TaxID=1917863 RepID=A0A2P2DWH6_9LEPT|nr:response regulator [Leptospira ryugenii]GBF48983.1 response regulator receiver domain protein [Leptospira ryugenii]
MANLLPFQKQKETSSDFSKRRPSFPVLIIEDREENQILLSGLCEEINVQSKVAANGQIALELIARETFSVFIVDLMMPVMDGKSFIKELKKIHPDAVILVQTAIDSSDEIIEIMKLGVYDYLIKPLQIELFKVVLEKALEYRYLIDIEKVLLMEESKELREELEWLSYKESKRKIDSQSAEMMSIYNLKTTLSQGTGLGTMTTLIDSIQSTSEKDANKNLLVDSDLMHLLFENNDHTKSMIRGLEAAVATLEQSVTLKALSSSHLSILIQHQIDDYKPFTDIKNLKINPPLVRTEYEICLDESLIVLAIKELLLNAIKYASMGTIIDTFITIIEGYLCLSIKNSINDDSYAEYSKQNQKLLTVPFFRSHPPVEAVHHIEPFSLGLGLTMVDYIANKHNGMFFIRNAKDHTSDPISLCTIAEFFIPIQKK